MGLIEGKLDNLEIKERLAVAGCPENLADRIVEQFWFHDFYSSFISDEIFLAQLIKYLKGNNFKSFNRYDFYKYFFDKIARPKSLRISIEQISLIFERIQSDSVIPEEFTKITRKIKATSGITQWLENNHLSAIKERDGKKLFIWEHHSITEFLVANYLTSLANTQEEFEKLAILNQEGIVALKPSWLGVLRFLLESPKAKQIFRSLIIFLQRYPENINNDISDLLTFVKVNLSETEKSEVFKLIHESYFNKQIWIPVWTRTGLAKFIDKKSYAILKKDLKKWSNPTETFVKRGNIVGIVAKLMEEKSKLLSATEKAFWKDELLSFINKPDDSGNGVLQRESLRALANFKDEHLIKIVAKNCFDNAVDSLVKDEFIQFCYASAPNSKFTINYLIQSVEQDIGIYARHGLYRIETKAAIKYFLQKVSVDTGFWRSFLEHESVFDKDDGDKQLLDKFIAAKNDSEVINLLKKIVFIIFRTKEIYQEERSNFIKEVVKIINSKDRNFIFEILEEIGKETDENESLFLFFDYQGILALLVNPENVREYFDRASKISPRIHERVDSVIYSARLVNGKVGEETFRTARKLKLVKPLIRQKDIDNKPIDRNEQIYNSFLKSLEPSPGKYLTNVFEYFVGNHETIERLWQPKERKKFLDLCLKSFLKVFDTAAIEVSIPNKGEHKFTWSDYASIYLDVVEAVKLLKPKALAEFRQQIINFIPFSFSHDIIQIIKDLGTVTDNDLKFVNSVLINEKDDRRYLNPSTYIYLIEDLAKGDNKLISAKSVLISFLTDKDISSYDRRSALESLGYLVSESDVITKKLLVSLFGKETDDELKNEINKTLISTFKDSKAINWRFKKIRKPILFNRREIIGKAHSVGPEEQELDWMPFAKPLTELADETYIPKFLSLLEYSFTVLNKQEIEADKNPYWNYANYLWKIAMSYFDKLKIHGSFKPYTKLESWYIKQSPEYGLNWLIGKIDEVKYSYINFIGKEHDV